MALRYFCTTNISPQHHATIRIAKNKKKLISATAELRNTVSLGVGVRLPSTSPIESLQRGNWVKLICGASFEDVVDIRNLTLVYTLAGVDCIDCAADASVINAVNEGIQAATNISSSSSLITKP